MILNKNDLITIISLIYRSEGVYKELEQSCLDNIKESEKLVERVVSLAEKVEENEDYLKIKNEVIQTNKKIKETLKGIRSLKSGKKTLFKWEFMNANSLKTSSSFYGGEELKEWLDINIKNDQKVICSNIDFEILYSFLKEDPKTDKKIINKYCNFIEGETTMYVSSPLSIKGKEIAFLHINKGKPTEQVLKCKNTDVVSSILLNISEDVDLTLLNNLRENNDLSLLYTLIYKEAAMLNTKSEDKEMLKKLSEDLENILRKDN